MATVTTRIDDLDGKTALPAEHESTVVSVRDGRESFTVKLDLSDKSFKALVSALAEFRDKGTEVTRKAPGEAASDAETERNREIRAWAVAHGHKVSDRGRLSNKVLEAFEAYERESASGTDNAA
jgi:hypothetical protein